jgi:hypothetical protein
LGVLIKLKYFDFATFKINKTTEIMNLYHFSHKYYVPDAFFPIGNFAKFIANQSKTVQEFEQLMEEKRVELGVSSPSRLKCIFTFSKEVAEGFNSDRKFLYELEVPEDEKLFTHNYEVGTYFSTLFHLNSIDVIKADEQLMEDYWKGTGPYIDSIGRDIGYIEEILVTNPLKIKRVIPWNKMSINDFSNSDLSFYHITPSSNIDNIIKNGLQCKNPFGICVSQSKHPLVVKYITEMMLNNGEDTEFSIIEINPKKHNIKHNEIIRDNVEEGTNEIHNYIKRNNIKILPKDLIDTYTANPLGIANPQQIIDELNNKGLLTSLF